MYCLIAVGTMSGLLISGQAIPRKVTKIIYDGKRFEIFCDRPYWNDNSNENCVFYGFWEDTVFSDKEAAEARLKELKERENG